MGDLEKLVTIAKAVRTGFDKYVEKNGGYGSDLTGFCHDASVVIFKLAKKYGIDKVQMGEGVGHWFVMLDGMIIDVTSTQFSQPDKVAVLPMERAEKIGAWWELQEKLDAPKNHIEYDNMRFAIEVAEEILIGEMPQLTENKES